MQYTTKKPTDVCQPNGRGYLKDGVTIGFQDLLRLRVFCWRAPYCYHVRSLVVLSPLALTPPAQAVVVDCIELTGDKWQVVVTGRKSS